MTTSRNHGMPVMQIGVAVLLVMASVADAAVTLDAHLSQESYARLEPIFLTITLNHHRLKAVGLVATESRREQATEVAFSYPRF